LSEKDINCIEKYKLQVYIIGDFNPSAAFDRIRNQIYGIRNFTGNVATLPRFRKLGYLGLLDYSGESDLRVLTNIINLTHLHLNTRNLHIQEIATLPTLSYLTLTCYEKVQPHAYLTPYDYRCKKRSLRDISFLSNFPYLQGLDISWNDVQDLTPLAGLENLRYLIARQN